MAKVYVYKCPKCREIKQFDRPSQPKCPKCGVRMVIQPN